ncbi:MAG TPA: AMP-binding protein, partial [Vicinamibacterales bacterium]|nr:AMP-binding protein [Vicinamibacterales bacterium]
MRRETLLDFFEDLERQTGPFLVHDDGYAVRQMSYAEVGAAARAFTAALEAHGIVAGNHIVIWSENRNEWVAAFWGALRAGVVVVPVDFRATPELLARIAGIVSARAVLVGAEVTPPATLPMPVWPLAEVRAPASWTEQGPPASLPSPSPTDIIEVIFTSGSTGTPKGVMLTHANIASQVNTIEQVASLTSRDVFIGTLPFFHSLGFTVTLWAVMTLDLQAAYHFSPLDAKQVGKLCKQYGGTLLLSTPTFLRGYLRRCEPDELGSLEVIVTGAEKLPKDVA